MGYNLITNIASCYVDIPNLLYYSHIPPAIIVLLFGLFLLLKNKENKLSSIILFFVSVIFSIWTLFDIMLWRTYSSVTMMSLWSLFGLLYALMYILSLYFIYVFIDKKDVSLKIKYIFAILLLPIIFLAPTKYNLSAFDVANCQPIEGNYFNGYQYSLGIFIIIWILVLIYLRYKKAQQEQKKQILFVGLGILLFLVAFSWSEIAGSITENFEMTQYGLFGAPVFIGFLAYLIVRYRAFSIKLIAAQALVIGIIILIASQYAFIQNPTNRILTAITLVIVSAFGWWLVRSVKKEVQQREQLAKLLKSRESLLHIINHKVKGAFTHSKYIFAEMLDGMFGVISPELKKMAENGLASDNEGIATIDMALNQASLQAGTIKYDIKPFDFKSVVAEVVSAKKGSAEVKGLKMETDIKKGNYIISGDQRWLKEAILNLVDNAVKCTVKGEITVGLRLKEKQVFFYVKDTGRGITPEDRKNLYIEGGRGKDSFLYNVDSTGYGLSTVKIVVEAHQGKVWEDTEVGKGSTFYVELPR